MLCYCAAAPTPRTVEAKTIFFLKSATFLQCLHLDYASVYRRHVRVLQAGRKHLTCFELGLNKQCTTHDISAI